MLVHVFPDADVPVIQLSIDAAKPPSYHLDLGRRLGALRDQGVLVVGSGDIVHNLARASFRQPDGAYDWATRFDADVQRYLRDGDDQALSTTHGTRTAGSPCRRPTTTCPSSTWRAFAGTTTTSPSWSTASSSGRSR